MAEAPRHGNRGPANLSAHRRPTGYSCRLQSPTRPVTKNGGKRRGHARDNAALALLVRLHHDAVCGALGGLLGWMLFGVVGDRAASGDDLGVTLQLLLGGALIGGLIGYFVVSVEALRDRSLPRFARLGTYGVLLGAAGGALGMLVGDWVNYKLVGPPGNNPGVGYYLSGMVIRGLGWMFLGVAVGVSEGIAARSLGKLSYGTLGGAVGGFVGGCFFGLCYLVTVQTVQAGGES